MTTTGARREPLGGRADSSPLGGPGTTLGSDVSTLVTTLVLVGSIVVVLLLVRTDRDQPATRRPARRRADAPPERPHPAPPATAPVVPPVAAPVAPRPPVVEHRRSVEHRPVVRRRPVVQRRRSAEPLPERVRSALALLVLLSCLGTALAAGVALVVFLVSLALRQSGSQPPGG